MSIERSKLYFKCETCGKCCCGEHGYIWVDTGEIDRIARFLRIGKEQFKNEYTLRSGDRISLKEVKRGKSLDCIFFRDKKCVIYDVRPEQCRTYPFWDTILKDKEVLEETLKDCPGFKIKDR